MSQTTLYPPPAFYFDVVVGGAGAEAPAVDGRFQEVSGIEATIGVEEVKEGGENRRVHKLPGRVTYPNLVLKRGLVTHGSLLAQWFSELKGSNWVYPVNPRAVQVNLLGADHLPRVSWFFERAYPVRWALGNLKSTENAYAVESLEMAYAFFERADWDS